MAAGPPDERDGGLIAGILSDADSSVGAAELSSHLLAVMIADIRGYTTFTQHRGDEAAAKLSAKFEATVRGLVSDFDGTVVEIRGDEALCVFSSPRQCLRLAVALQRRFVEETIADADLPMPVGIGIDVGEAVRVGDGYRGGALNLAARLCGVAKAGQVLASPEAVHLARTIDGIRYADVDRVALKGLPVPVRPVRVYPAGEDPAQQMPALIAAARSRPPRKRGRHALIAAVAVACAVGATLAVVLTRDTASGHQLRMAENSLGVIDPQAGRLVAQVPIAAGPTAIAAGFGSIWTANIDDNSVARVNPTTLQVVDSIPVGVAPSAIATGAGAVWVTNSGERSVTRIDPATGLTESIPVGAAPSSVVAAAGSVWVTNSGDGTVSRIDPATNSAVKTINVGSAPSGIAAGAQIWVTNAASNSVSEIDPHSGAVIRQINVGNGPGGIAVVGKGVWVADNTDGKLARIAPDDVSPSEIVTVGQLPNQVAAVDGHLWTTVQGSSAVVEVDPAGGGRVLRRIGLGPVPGGIAAVNGKLWVTSTINRNLHHGGTLRVLVHDLSGVDPSYQESSPSAAVFAESYDGLVSYRHASGADGRALVPDLATAIPTTTDGGRTYTFHVRQGVRWSTGDPVTVDDVQRGIERGVLGITALSASQELRHLIVGATDCRPESCDISGITADDAARTVTIKLVRPTGELLDQLAFCPAVPATTPLAQQHQPIAATGPYQIVDYVPNKFMAMTRNPYFHEWSAAAQPQGFPDRIEFHIRSVEQMDQAIDEAGAGRSELADDVVGPRISNGARFAALQTQFGNQLRTSPTQDRYGVFLNTRIPPFDNPRVRQALAYAIDRNGVREHWFLRGDVTCQFIAPGFPGYRPYCPYTTSPDGNLWQGADLATARALVKGLHPERTKVIVWAWPISAPGMGYVVTALRELGYHAKLRVWPDMSYNYFHYIGDTRNHVQAGFWGWVGSGGNTGGLLEPWRCVDFVPNSRHNNNGAGFCDPRFERLWSRADRTQATSLAVANDVWARADQRLVDAAPWIPLISALRVDVLAKNVHGYKRAPAIGVLYDQMWLR